MEFWPCCSFRSQSYILIHDHTAVENNILQKISRVSTCSGYWHFGWRFNVPFIASRKFEMFCMVSKKYGNLGMPAHIEYMQKQNVKISYIKLQFYSWSDKICLRFVKRCHVPIEWHILATVIILFCS